MKKTPTRRPAVFYALLVAIHWAASLSSGMILCKKPMGAIIGEEHVPTEKIVDVAMPKTPEKPVAFLRIGDSEGQVDYADPFSVARRDANVVTRIKFIQNRLEQKGGRMKIVIGLHDTKIYESWNPAHSAQFSQEDMASPARIGIEWHGRGDEHPELLLVGAISEATTDLLGESPAYVKSVQDAIALTKKELQARITDLKKATPVNQEKVAELEGLLRDEGRFDRELSQMYRLRTAWEAKLSFYKQYVRQNPWLKNAPTEPPARTLQTLMEKDPDLSGISYRNEPERYRAAESAYETELRTAFTDFYSKHDDFRLNPVLIENLWRAPQPKLLESSSLNPIFLLNPILFQSP